MSRAIQYGKEALRITRQIGDRQNECLHLFNFGCAFHSYGEVEARRHYLKRARSPTKSATD